MKKTAFFMFIVLFILLHAGCNINQNQKSGGYIVFQPVDHDMRPLPELTVLDVNGEPMWQIDLAEDIAPLYGVQGTFTRYAVFASFTGEHLLRLDVETGEVQEYTGFTTNGETVAVCGIASSWVLFCGSSSVHLLNNITGDLTTLPPAIDLSQALTRLYVIQVSPDESTFVIFLTNQNLYWLVTLDDPQNPRLLGGENAEKVGSVSLSEDGKQIIYILRNGDDVQVIQEAIDGLASEVLLSGAGISRVDKIPGHEQLLVVRDQSVSVFSMSDQSEDTITALEDFIRYVMIDPEGTHAAIQWGGAQTDIIRWSFIDLQTKTVIFLDDLDAFDQVRHVAGSKWAFVSNFSNESNKYAIYSLNLTNGTTHPLLQTTLTAVPVFSGAKLDSDALLVDFSEGKLWLLQAENDKSISLSDNFGGNASLSADGSWVVFSETGMNGDKKEDSLVLFNTETGNRKKIGVGVLPLWVNP